MMLGPAARSAATAGWLLLAALHLSGCRSAPRPLVLGEVNGEPITLEDARGFFEERHRGHLSLLRGKSELQGLVERIADHRLFLQEARRLGMDADPEYREAVERFRDSLARKELHRREVEDAPPPGEEEVRALHAALELSVELRMIHVATRGRAEDLRRRILAGEDFEALAREFSRDRSARAGGLTPALRRGEMDEAIEEVAFGLPEGELSEVLEAEDGFRLIRVEKRHEGETVPPFEALRPSLAQLLARRARERRTREFLARLRSQARWRVTEDLPPLAEILAPEGERDERVLAEVEGETIRVRDIRPDLDPRVWGAMDPEFGPLNLRIHVMNRVHQVLVLAEARRRGLDRLPDVEAQVRSGSDQLLLGGLQRRYVFSGIEVTEEEARRFYEENAASFASEEQVNLDQILVPTEEEARDLLRALEKGEDFADLARARSKDPASAHAGGRVGWVGRGQLLAELEAAAFALRPGEFSGVIGSPVGFHVLRVRQRLGGERRSFEEVRLAAHRQVRRNKERAAAAAWAEKLRERSGVRVDDGAIEAAIEIIRREAPPRKPPPEGGHAGSESPPGAPGREGGPHAAPGPEGPGSS